MANRSFPTDAHSYTQGVVYLDFSFACNTASDPVSSSFRGEGVATVAHSATGKYLVTLADGFRYCIGKTADLEDAATDDGAYASIGAISNEATANTALSFYVYTRSAGGTKTDYASPRRVTVSLALKNSAVGK